MAVEPAISHEVAESQSPVKSADVPRLMFTMSTPSSGWAVRWSSPAVISLNV